MGTVYYRPTSTPTAVDISRMAADVASAFPSEPAFTASFLNVVTYFAIAPCCSNSNVGRNTFQIAMAADTSGRSFVTMCYDTLTYGASTAAVGFNAPSSSSYYNFPGSMISSNLKMSCGGKGGCYTFRVDGASAVLAPLLPSLYSGSGTDTCSHGLTTMYPFGVATADSVGTGGDAVNAVTLSWSGTPFKFYGTSYYQMYFSTNGWLCFTTNDNTPTGRVFPSYSNPVRK